ncbi:protein TolQ, partial [Roseateles sp. DJS-2-20]
MNQDISIVALILHASLPVQLVIGILLLSSLASWS